MTKKAYMTLAIGDNNKKPLGTLQLVLYDETVPRTVHNFLSLLQTEYTGSSFHRIIRGFMAQGGDVEHHNGTGGSSIYGSNKTFDDENFLHDHVQRGTLSMANSGAHSNGSQFFITFRATPHLNGKHVVFGHVDLAVSSSHNNNQSAHVLDQLERVAVGANDAPLQRVTIVDGGLLLDEEEVEEGTAAKQLQNPASAVVDDSSRQTDKKFEMVQEEEDDEYPNEEYPEDDDEPYDSNASTTNKADLLKRRVRQLKMKMNQARQLNRVEVKREGERLGSLEGMTKEQKRQAKQDRKVQQAEWQARNAKAMEVAAQSGMDVKFVVEQAGDSVRKAQRQAEKEEQGRFSVKDYHNPEGQHRNYERNLKSLPRSAPAKHHTNHHKNDVDHDDDHDRTAETYNPTMVTTNSTTDATQTTEREGARRLAKELRRRMEKQQNRKRKIEFDEADVSYINQRNKHFNEKISRNFDKHTAEIRQNLERGTAL
jgi:cyclophilin family peptidyl-prolyl cis-trans isomerase